METATPAPVVWAAGLGSGTVPIASSATSRTVTSASSAGPREVGRGRRLAGGWGGRCDGCVVVAVVAGSV